MKIIRESEEVRTKITDYLNNANDNEMSSISLDSYEDLGDTETGHKYKVKYSVTTHNITGQDEESGDKIYKDVTDYHADEIEIPCEVGECLTEDKVPTDLPKGTLVDFGPYGDLYIVREIDDETWWASDEPDDESGWSIKKDLADKVISYPDDYDEDDDIFEEATQASNVSSGKVDSIDLLEYIDPEQEMRDSDVFLEIDEIAYKYGYILGNAFRDGDQIVIELSNDHQYAPEIWYDYRTEEFKITTDNYGSLRLNEYEQFVRYVQDARDCARELSDVDLTDIYVLPDDVEVPLDEDWRDGSFTQDDLDKYLDKINEDAYAIKYSLEKMIDKHPEYRTEILSQVASIRNTFSLMHDNLSEDTVKRGNKWVNVGKSGKTHGEFRTKKQADAQRRAMFANKAKTEKLELNNKLCANDTELADALIEMINAEWDTINDYNKLHDYIVELGHNQMLAVIDDINSEENKHVGQLQECLKQISEVTNDIAKGEDEGAEQLELLEPDPDSDCTEDDCLDYEIVQLDLLDDIL